MYVGHIAHTRPDQPAVIMAPGGEQITFGELDARANRLAHYFRSCGLQTGDHIAIFMENHLRYIECESAAERAGLYFTCINSYLNAEEVAYIVNDCRAKLLITSHAKAAVACELPALCPDVETWLMVARPYSAFYYASADGSDTVGAAPPPFLDFDAAAETFPTTPIADESLGAAMLYSSGTTGRPKGIVRALTGNHPSANHPLFVFLDNLWRYRDDMVYLSPAPLYHSAPQAAVSLTLRRGSTVIVMERFDPELYLQLVERHKVTHSQLVPTMFSRMLKLPDEVRAKYDVSSLEQVVHAAAPCPVQVKQAMIDWWGPKLLEYYGATEGMGFTFCDSAQWLSHPGTVGQVILGELHVLDENGAEVPNGTPGTLWFKPPQPFEYFNDPSKTAESRSDDGTLATVGDVGYVDDDGFVFLTDRKTFMIISGGVNIYPQECENLLITHPKVTDAAVFGVPNADLGEEVKAVVQAAPGVEPGPELARELIAFCKEHLASMKCPRTIDFEAELPRLPTGKLYKRVLRDRYWEGHTKRI